MSTCMHNFHPVHSKQKVDEWVCKLANIDLLRQHETPSRNKVHDVDTIIHSLVHND